MTSVLTGEKHRDRIINKNILLEEDPKDNTAI